MVSSSSSCPSTPGKPDFEWLRATPEDEEEYVQALQTLGIEMATACPPRVREEAIPPLGTESTSELLVGKITSRCKERLVNLS